MPAFSLICSTSMRLITPETVKSLRLTAQTMSEIHSYTCASICRGLRRLDEKLFRRASMYFLPLHPLSSFYFPPGMKTPCGAAPLPDSRKYCSNMTFSGNYIQYLLLVDIIRFCFFPFNAVHNYDLYINSM